MANQYLMRITWCRVADIMQDYDIVIGLEWRCQCVSDNQPPNPIPQATLHPTSLHFDAKITGLQAESEDVKWFVKLFEEFLILHRYK